MIHRLFLLGITVAIGSSQAHFNATDCGTKKQCVFIPHGCQESNSCRQMFSYNGHDDGWTDMEMFSKLDTASNNYMAVGFSSDDLMGDDPVTHCAFPADGNGDPEAHLTYNFGKSNAAPNEDEDIAAEKSHVELVHAHKSEDGMYCQIRQKSGKGDKQYFPDLTREAQLLIVRGKTRSPRALGIHSLDPSSPDFPFTATSTVAVGKPTQTQTSVDAEAPTTTTTSTMTSASEPFLSPKMRFWLVKVHGMMMIVAWVVMVALAILSARYLRDHFPSSNPLGLKWWFHIHRTLNLAAVVLIILSTFVIFQAKSWNWTGPAATRNSEENTNPGAIHSLLGAIAVCVAIIQPLMSLMRCAPDTGARPIFNWTHRILGFIGLICALAAMIIATNSFVSLWSDPNWSLAIAVFYVVVVVVVFILFEVLSHLKTRNPNKSSAVYEMRSRNAQYDDNGRVVTSLKIINSKPMYAITLLYAVFATFAVAVAALLIVLMVS